MSRSMALAALVLAASVSWAEEASAPVYRTKLGNDATVETSLSPAAVLTNFFLLPLAYAFAIPHGGFERYPYETEAGYGGGEREAAGSLRTSRQAVDGRQAQHAHLRIRGGNHLGWDVGMSSYDPRIYSRARRAALWSAHVTANYLQTRTALLELGIGGASFQDPAARGGLSGELALELFPARPWTLAFRYHGAAIHGTGFHDLSAGVGVTWRWFGLSAGYRAFLNPIDDVAGPEATFLLWF